MNASRTVAAVVTFGLGDRQRPWRETEVREALRLRDLSSRAFGGDVCGFGLCAKRSFRKGFCEWHSRRAARLLTSGIAEMNLRRGKEGSMPDDEEIKPGTCHFHDSGEGRCSTPDGVCSADFFCHGCRVYVCEQHERNLSLFGSHLPEDHRHSPEDEEE